MTLKPIRLLVLIPALEIILLHGTIARALDDGLALTPPMGWNSWNKFACNVSGSLIKSTADAIATNGMKAAGY